MTDGQNRLYNRLKSSKDSNVASDIILNILTAIQRFHDFGVCNIDLNPKSILIGARCEISFLDNGILKLWSKHSEINHLCHKYIYFDPEYAAPEIVLDDIMHQNPKTDIYVLGILYFQLITGNVPFAGTEYEVMYAQLKKTMSVKLIKDLRIRKIIKKATEKDQRKRYESCAHFKAAIENEVFSVHSRLPWWQRIFK